MHKVGHWFKYCGLRLKFAPMNDKEGQCSRQTSSLGNEAIRMKFGDMKMIALFTKQNMIVVSGSATCCYHVSSEVSKQKDTQNKDNLSQSIRHIGFT